MATADCVDTGAGPGRTPPVQTQEASKRAFSQAFIFLEQMFHSFWVTLGSVYVLAEMDREGFATCGWRN